MSRWTGERGGLGLPRFARGRVRLCSPFRMADFPILFAVSVAWALTSCSDGIGPEVDEYIDDAGDVARHTLDAHLEQQSRPLLRDHEEPYLPRQRVAHSGVLWLHEWVEIRVADLPLDISLAKAMEQLANPPSVVFTSDLHRPDVPVTLHHRGPFRDFLDLLADASGYGWEEKGGALYWMAEITRTFEVHRVPGNLVYSMATVETSEEVLETGVGAGTVSQITATPESGGEITLDGGGTFWTDLESTLSRLFTEAGGKAPAIDRNSGTVVLSGPAHMVRKAGRYIQALNRWLSRQVLLEVQLVKVTLSGKRNLGIDWNLVQDAATLATTSVGVSAMGTFAAGLLGPQIGVTLAEGSRSIFRGSEIVISALEGQGQTSVQTSPRIVALNGQAAQLQVLDDRSIVSSRSVTVTGGVQSTQRVSVSPSTVSTGIALTILPKIVGARVFLQTSIQVSDLVDLRVEGNTGEQVTLPHVQRNQFFQSARLRSGETLALGGLVSREGVEGGENLPGVSLLGTSSQSYKSIETVLLITPTLLDQVSPDESLLK